MDNQKKKINAAVMSVVSNSLLVISKLVVGVLVGSVSIISEAIHSGVDLLASLIAWFSVSKSSKQRDKKHQWGHGKIENISGTIEALLIFIAAIWILFEAISKIKNNEPLENVQWGVAVMAVSCVANLLISEMLFRVGNATDSVALKADAWHLRTDVWTSFGVLAGLSIIYLGKIFFPQINLHIIDPIFAIIVAMIIFKAAWDLTIHAGQDLLDLKLPDEEIAQIEQIVHDYGFPVLGINDIRTRKSGSTRYIELHVEVKHDLTVIKAHEVGDEITMKIKLLFNESEVTVHIDPCKKDKCEVECVDHCVIK